MKRSGGVVFLILAYCLVIPFNFPYIADANPLSAYHFNTGTTVSLTEYVNMPHANVNISIDSVKTDLGTGFDQVFNHTIEMASEFEISSDLDQNVSIAFAYPRYWGYGNERDASLVMQIKLNNTPLDFTLVNGSDLEYDSDYERSVTEILEDLSLAVIDTDLLQGYVYILEVGATIDVSTSANVFVYRYTVWTASTWGGNPQETVRITVEDSEIFRNVTFTPEESLRIDENGNGVSGTWSLDFSTEEPDVWDVYCTIDQYVSDYFSNDRLLDLQIMIGTLSIVGVVFLWVIYRRRK